jgi:hypothetical protein
LSSYRNIDLGSYFVRLGVVLVLLFTFLNYSAGSSSGNTSPEVVAPVTQNIIQNAQAFKLPGFSLSNFNSTIVQVTVTLTGSASSATVSIPENSRTLLTLSPGFSWSGQRETSFYGTVTNINSALSNLTIATGNETGNVEVTVNATKFLENANYFAGNGHYYEFINTSGITYANAKTAAANKTLEGRAGHLVTITNQDEQDFVRSKIPNASNIWIAATDSRIEGLWEWDAGNEVGKAFWKASCVAADNASSTCSVTSSYSSSGGSALAFSVGSTNYAAYSNWCSSEPNNSDSSRSGEHHAVTNWNGGNCWNDLNGGNTLQIGGYVVEYPSSVNDSVENASNKVSFTVVSGATPIAVSTTAGNAQSVVTWNQPAVDGLTFSSFNVTTSAGVCAQISSTSCFWRDIPNGQASTITVTANFTNGSSLSTTQSVTPNDSRPSITGPVAKNVNWQTATSLGTYNIADPFSCGWTSVTATASTNIGTLSAAPIGGASVEGSGNTSLKITGTRSEVNSILSNMQLIGDSGSGVVTVSVTPAINFIKDGVRYLFNSQNGHYYSIDETLRNRLNASTSAQSLTYCGSKGYLVTIVDQDEQNFIEAEALTTSSGDLWTSGENSDGWKWKPGIYAPTSESAGTVALFETRVGVSPWHANEPNGNGIYHQLWFTGGRYGWDDVGDSNKKSLIEYGTTASFTPASVQTNVNIVTTPPSAPVINSISAGNGQLQVSFTPPSSNGGSVITDYQYSVDNGSTWVSLGTTSSPATISGLVSGDSYDVQIRAVNGAGNSSASNLITALTATSPSAPLINSLSPGNGSITVNLTQSSDGGSAITDYEYSLDGGQTWISSGTSSSPFVISGLRNGPVYSVLVRAVNVVGASAASNSLSVGLDDGAWRLQPTLEPTPTPSPTPTRTPLSTPTIQPTPPVNPLPSPTPTPTTQSTPQSGAPNNFAPLVVRAIEEVVDALKPVAFDALVGLISKAIDEIRSSIGQNALVLLLDRNTAESLVNSTNSIILDTPTAVLKDGVAEPARIVVIDTTQLQVVSGEGGLLKLEAKDGEDSVPVDSQGRLQMLRNNLVEAEGTGFAANSEFAVWLFSDPTMLGIGKTDLAGRFFASFPVEKDIPLGDHTLQVVGVTSSGEQRSISLPVIVLDNKEAAMNNSIDNVIQVSQNPVQKWFDSLNYLAILMFLVIFLALWMLWIMRRRKDEEEEIDLANAALNDSFVAPRPSFEKEAVAAAAVASNKSKPASSIASKKVSSPAKKRVTSTAKTPKKKISEKK